MEKQLPRSIKLELRQPMIMCSGRSIVNCTYRAKVVEEDENYLMIQFKYLGKIVKEKYSKSEKMFLNLEMQDLHIK